LSGMAIKPTKLKSLIITHRENLMDNLLSPIHPGEVLLEDFMKPLGLSQYRLAKDIGVSSIRISQIVKGQRSISVDTAMRLAQYFSTSAAVWLRLQVRYDLEAAQNDLGERIKREVKTLHQPIARSSV
jgi:addiction module HigA family antidote